MPLRAWAQRLEHLCGHNKATIALDKKLVRIVRAVWRGDAEVTEQAAPAA